jgi:hypothetical protein
LVVAGTVLALLAIAVLTRSDPPATDSQSSAPTAPVFDLQIWHWSNRRRLTPAEEQNLAALPLDAVCEWRGSVEMENGRPRFYARGGRVLGLAAVARWAVLRLEPACLPLLDGDGIALRDLLLEGLCRAEAKGPVRGLQLDWDVPVRRLGAYARFLTALRGRLAPGQGLSCTGLVSWLGQPALAEVVAAVDWWAPQCYSNDLPNPRKTTRLVLGEDPVAVARRCEELGRPYRIGLPVFEQASLWDADGAPLTAALPITVEGAMAAGLALRELPSSEERLLYAQLLQDTPVCGRFLGKGSQLMIGIPTVISLARQLARLRAAAGPWCRGVCLFRLASPGDLPCLSTVQLRAAWQRSLGGVDALQTPSPEVSWRWEGGPGAWNLHLVNQGLADLVAPERPLQLSIDWSGPTPILSPPLRALPAFDGEPASPAHANGILVQIPFLRAGADLTLPPFVDSGTSPPACRRPEDALPEEHIP